MKRAIAWFAENHVAANLLMVMLIAGGLVALPLIQQKTFPDIDVDMVQIGVRYLGAAPEEVEEGVCIRIEEEIHGIEGIEEITSSAAEGACGVTAELIDGYPVDRALSEIKNAVDSISTFPAETEKPVINHLALMRDAVQVAVSGDASEETLKVLGERLRDGLAALPGITQVEVTNAREYEISIEVSEQALRRYGLTFDEVVASVRRGSLDRPGGSIKTTAGEVLLRTKGQAYVGEDFEKLVILTREDGTRLLLGEVANVVDGFEDEDKYAIFDGKPAVLVKVYRVGDQKVLDLVERAKAYVEEASLRLPAGVEAIVWQDGSQALRDRLDILVRNGRAGFILVFVVLALFLRLRLAVWVSLGVPLSFMGALALFPPLDISIDVISLFAFILVLGLLVDDAIVVGENVHRHQESNEVPLQAAIAGTQEVAVPVIFGVLTTVVAFVPMILAPGTMGQIFGTIGVVVICCLLFSLIESQLVLPAHLGHMRVDATKAVRAGGSQLAGTWMRVQNVFATSLERIAKNYYAPALRGVLEWRYTTVAVALGLLFLIVSIVASGILKFSFFPFVEADYVSARLAMPPGSPVAVTEAAVREVEAAARRVKLQLDQEYSVDGRSIVKHFLTSVGEQPSSRGNPTSPSRPLASSHLGEVTIELVGGNQRPLSARAIVQRWRDETPAIPDVQELTFTASLFSAGDPINVQLHSPDVAQLERAADQLKQRLAKYPGVFDIGDSFEGGKEEIQLDILPAAQALGLTLDDLASQVRHAFYGVEAQRIQRGRDDVRVMIRYPEAERRSLADLDNMRIRTPSGGEVPFYAVAKARAGIGYSTIKRANRQRAINVTADVDLVQGNANEILADLQRGFLRQLVLDHPGVRYTLEGEQKEQAEAASSLVRNYLMALVLIYALLAVPLRSYSEPLLIMSVIPFGAVGAILGHLMMGMNLSMMSVFGIVALSGVVVNSSLVLVHYVGQKREQGEELFEAVRAAGTARFRPIVLTSITTFAGLTPLLLEGSMGSAFLKPMATSLGFGVVFATLVSLFLLPSGYLILQDLRRMAVNLRSEFGSSRAKGSLA
ncbi:MAG: efflux RND transporter permease subunit [Myxococcota bacterium]